MSNTDNYRIYECEYVGTKDIKKQIKIWRLKYEQ